MFNTMGYAVRATSDPRQVIEETVAILGADPIQNNLVLSLLHARAVHPEPGRYWIVTTDGTPVGVVLQSPPTFAATLTPMARTAIEVAVEAIVGDGNPLPGVIGESASAASFAGHWTERTKAGARPVIGQRIYEIEKVIPPKRPAGGPRPATGADTKLVTRWVEAFRAEAGDGASEQQAGAWVERRIAAGGRLHIWDDGGPVALTGSAPPVAGAVRVGPVYTPPERRSRGYASALVAEVSGAELSTGNRCLLYTDLANPTSNSIYRAIGYHVVAEILRYAFDGPD